MTSDKLGELSLDSVKVTTLPVAKFPTLALAQENLRSQVLRQAAWNGEKRVEIVPEVNAASKDAIALLVRVKAGDATRYAGIAYDIASNRAYGSPALIEPARWADFVAAVAAAEGGDKVAPALAEEAYPFGNAPALAFLPDGGLLVLGEAHVVVPADQVSPMLTPLGRKLQAGATKPEKAEPAQAVKDPEPGLTGAVPAAGGATASPAEPSGTATPSPSGDSHSARPRISLGPDCEKLKCVALTFDDGPVPETRDLVKVLRDKRAPVSFFALGNNVKAHPGVLKEIAAEGHQVGWHTVTHGELPRLSADRVRREVGEGPTSLLQLVGWAPTVFRPPYGAHNAKVDEVIKANNMVNVMWSVDTKDWDKTRVQGEALTQAVISSAVRDSKPGGIILVHDIHATSRAAAGPIVDQLTKQGFTFVTVTELPGWQDFSWGKSYCAAPSLKASCF
ncbi:MAG: polysaccharide deacetylase family protein [Propionibacteriaceae bacterium]|nr:polysaccharide deacetylase family protein [Propionibacteriaceae bacterium]